MSLTRRRPALPATAARHPCDAACARAATLEFSMIGIIFLVTPRIRGRGPVAGVRGEDAVVAMVSLLLLRCVRSGRDVLPRCGTRQARMSTCPYDTASGSDALLMHRAQDRRGNAQRARDFKLGRVKVDSRGHVPHEISAQCTVSRSTQDV